MMVTLGTGSTTVTVPALPAGDTTPPTQNYTVYVNQMRGSGVIDANDPGGCAGLTPQTCYSLSAITINVGDSVTWINKDTTNNWYTLMGSWGGLAPPGGDNACDGPGKLSTDMCGISGNDRTSWTHTFDQVGTYNYHDWVYQNSAQRPEGVVNVVASGAPSPSSQLPVMTTGDTTPPAVNVYQSTMTNSTSNPAGKIIEFTAFVSDNVGVVSGPTCIPASGSLFPVGTTTVTCIATDTAGNVGTGGYTVTVNYTADTTPPTMTASAYLNTTSSTAIHVYVIILPAGLEVEFVIVD